MDWIVENIETIFTLLGVVWAFFKGTTWYRKLKEHKWALAIGLMEQIADSTVTKIERGVVEAKKANSDGGEKLTAAEITEIRKAAHEVFEAKAIELGKKHGVDLLAMFDNDYIDALLELTHKKFQAAEAATKTATSPELRLISGGFTPSFVKDGDDE